MAHYRRVGQIPPKRDSSLLYHRHIRSAIVDAVPWSDYAARNMSAGRARAARALLTSYGSCSTSTPLTEARDFGLIDTAEEAVPE